MMTCYESWMHIDLLVCSFSRALKECKPPPPDKFFLVNLAVVNVSHSNLL